MPDMLEPTVPAASSPQPAGAPDGVPLLDPRVILTSIAEVVYDWRLDTDALRWGANAKDVLKVADERALASGRSFSRLLDPEALTNRHEAVVNSSAKDLGGGVPYQIQYSILPHGRDQELRFWIEDTGRWFAGPNGEPQRAHGVMRVINDRHNDEQRLAFLSRFDELTGQMNRSRLAEVLDTMIETAKRYRTTVAFLLAGIDNLATINDAYGYEVADEVIGAVARRIRSCMRAGDGLGRFSGNKFGIIINKCDVAEVPVVAQRFIEVVGEEVAQTSAGPIAVRISVGGVLAPRHARNASDAMMAAQEALASCKATRRGGFLNYAPSVKRDEMRRDNAKLTDDIVSALNDRRMVLAFEPIVDATSREAVLHECLVRLKREDGSLVPAGAIVPISEKLGLVRLIDHRVLELAIEELAAHPEARCTINLSAATATDQDWLTSLALRLHALPGVAERLVVEITESAAIGDLHAMGRFIRSMKDYGTKVAIDDFGAGHTSFRGLRELSIDMVKIDGAFIQNMTRSADDRFFVRTLIDLARHLGLEIVAEWVQDEETARQLASWGCNYLQGMYLGRASTTRPWPKPQQRASVA
jgi:diguanylate cyclase (GGDEF)-like protein